MACTFGGFMMRRVFERWSVVVSAALTGFWALGAEAQVQDPQIIVVPFAQQNPALPHPAHEGARVTLKAILRNAACAGGYRIHWDIDADGNFDEETLRLVTPTSGTVLDIGRTFEVPNVDRDSRLPISVRVRNTCTNTDAFATYRMFVYDFTANADPRNWTNDQVAIMGQMAVQESLWWMHRQQANRANVGQSTLHARFGNYSYVVNGVGLWAFTANGHLPAYPPGSINTYMRPLPDVRDANGNIVPNGWNVQNDARWNSDPYAETVLAYINGALNAGTNYVAIPNVAGNLVCPLEEANTCGYNPDGTERVCARLAGTNDCRGVYAGGTTNVYAMGMLLGGLATALPAFGGTPLQVGAPLAGTNWEVFIQQMTDLLGYQQYDGGCAQGGWLYDTANGAGGCGNSDSSTSQWAYIGFESAEINGGPFGVFVNNRHKFRIAENLVNNQHPAGGGSQYRSGENRSNFQLTGGAFVAARWLNVHQMARGQNTVAFPGYSQFTRDRLRQAYDSYVGYTSSTWQSANLQGHAGWASGLYQNGDYLCGNTNAVYNAGRCGNTYAMYSHQKGYRTGTPEITTIPNAVAGQPAHDWFRQFTIYYARAQDRTTADYTNFGRIIDEACAGHVKVTCNYGAPWLSGAFGGLSLTNTLFKPKPVAQPVAQPSRVTEGCIGGNSGLVTFSHDESFHPSASARILLYRWDFDASNGLWWETNAAPDYQTNAIGDTFQHRYLSRGNYTATLQVVDSNMPSLTDTRTVSITVDAAANEGPSVASGGGYVLEVGSALELRGTATDRNVACGDTLQVAWDLNNANTWNFAGSANQVVPFNVLANLPLAQPIPLRIRARDAAGLTQIAETTLTIYPVEPVADGQANPNPAACGQAVRFDASSSYHVNPERSVVRYAWNVDGRAGFEYVGEDPTYTHTYGLFGPQDVTLRVYDDLGRFDDQTFRVNVNLGNLPPNPNAGQPNYVVLEGDPLRLDGRGSSDPNQACGDGIVRWQWDLNNDGNFAGPGDVQGSQPVVPWADVSARFAWPADRNTGLPTNVVTLRVTDTFGATATVAFTVTVYLAIPIPQVTQTPRPAPINLVTGDSNPTLDGRESRSPIPGMTIARYDWDLQDDGNFEVMNQPVVEFSRRFMPVPAPDAIPNVFVRLRVVDRDGRTQTTRYQVIYRVPPTPPTADADPTDPPERAYHILLGEGVVFDASDSFDPDSAEFGDFIQSYRWDFGNGDLNARNVVWDRVVPDANGDRVEARLALSAPDLAGLGADRPGTYPVLLEIEDTTALTNRDTTSLSIYARDPVALLTANPNPATCGARISFDGTRSDHPHPDVDVVSLAWDLDGDGQYDDSQEGAPTRIYNEFTFDEPITIGLQVRDSNGNVGVASAPLDINLGNRAPVATPGGPYVIAVNDTLRLDGRASAEPDAACGDRIVRWEWDLGANGSYEFSSVDSGLQDVTWAQLNQSGINNLGNYNVRLRVTDRFGVSATRDVQLRVVRGPQAVGVAIPNSAGCNDRVTFDGTASNTDGPPNAGFDIVRWEWDLGADGTFDAEGQRVQANAVGRLEFAAILRVTDQSGRRSTSAPIVVTINQQNLPPIADAFGPYATGRANGQFVAVRLDGRRSFDPNRPCDAIATYAWDTDLDGLFGAADANGAPGIVGSDHVGATVDYRNPNWQVGVVQLVRLRVCDTFGACSNPAEAEIQVQNEAPPQGEIISPRADGGLCIAGVDQEVRFTVADAEGEPVTAILLIGGVEFARTVVQTLANGQPVAGVLTFDGNDVPDGARDLQIRFEDNQGGVSLADAGGRVTFDHTPPVVQIGPQLVENVCYNPNNTPQPALQANDNLDRSLTIEQATTNNGCGRTLTVTAIDDCGNTGSAARGYRAAEPVEVEIQGALEGQLVRDPRITWSVVGPADCAGQIVARVSRDGGAPGNYVANTVINVPGVYVLTLTVPNCAGVARDVTRGFIVNAPPVAVPVPAAHPNLDPAAMNPRGYIADEGDVLTVDGQDSLAPEEIDQVARYDWDFTGNGSFDAQGATTAYPTDEDGLFVGILRATDSVGATSTAPFQVTVRDVDPIADGGGPYRGAQGAPVAFDARGSRPGSAADPIARYRWEWNDGSAPQEGANLSQPSHTFLEDGIYTVRLTVFDEDSSTSVDLVVQIDDVSPVIRSLAPPADPYEIADMRFELNTTFGAPGDPITRIEWDFDGDGSVEFAGPLAADTRSVVTNYRDAGARSVTVRVRDKDSESTLTVDFDVREITLGELIDEGRVRADRVIANPDAPRAAKTRLTDVDYEASTENGAWGERRGYRGNTWVAFNDLTFALYRSQAVNGEYGNLLWAMSRQAIRESTRLRTRFVEVDGAADPDSTSILIADQLISEMRVLFDEPDFEDDVGSANGGILARDLINLGANAYFYLMDGVDPVYQYYGSEGFPVPDIRDPAQRVEASNAVNDNLQLALAQLATELEGYDRAGVGANDPGPGRLQVQAARRALTEIQRLTAQNLAIDCEPGTCISDGDALENEMLLMDLIEALYDAAGQGVYVRQWQNVLLLAVKFRIELSLLRVENVCGLFSATSRSAREVQASGLDIYTSGDRDGALQYYIDPDRRCFIIRVYNDCLVTRVPGNLEYPYPDVCVAQQ